MAFVARPQVVLTEWVDRGLYVLEDRPAPVVPLWQTLLGVWIFLLGAGVIAWDYAALPAGQLPYLWFWVGMALCLAGVLIMGLRAGVSEWVLLGGLAALAAALYLPVFLRSPTYLTFQDEVYHYQILQLLVASGHVQVPVTIFAIAGSYPGLELFGALTHWATGLPLLATTRIVALMLHETIPLLVYLVLRMAHLGRRPAFLGALVFCANTSFFFFHSLFSYETQGVLLFAALAYCLIASEHHPGQPWIGLAVPVLAALTVTHHASSIAAAFLLLVFTIIAALRSSRNIVGYVTLTILGLILPSVWFLTGARPAVGYLYGIMDDRFVALFNGLANLGAVHPRTLFQRSQSPGAEHIVAYLYAPIILILSIIGIVILVRWHRAHGSPVLWTALGILGPLLWLISIPLVFTHSSDIAYRGWPFTFIGLGLFAGTGLAWLSVTIQQTSDTAQIAHAAQAWRPAALVFLVSIILLEGAISIGDNQAGRFPQNPPVQSAGPQALTPDTLAAAQWLDETAGRYHRMVGDITMGIAFGGYGFENMSIWATWIPFLTTNTAVAQRYLQTYQVQYVAVDRRDSQLPARYGYYFSQQELFIPGLPDYGATSPLASAFLTKFDQMSGLERIYDNGNVLIYQNTGAGS